MVLGMEVGLSPDDLMVLDGDTAPSPKRGRSAPPLKFSAHVYCGQKAGWIKMALGTEVGRGPSHIVLGGDPARLPKKWDRAPKFSALIVAKRLDASGCHLVWM